MYIQKKIYTCPTVHKNNTLVMRMQKVAPLCDSLLALSQNSGLSSDLAQLTDDCLVAIDKTHQCIRNVDVAAKLLHKLLRGAQVVARNARVKMVDGLKLQASMEEVQPLRTINIHSGAQHLLRERLVWPMIHRAHGEVRQSDLHMKWHGHHVADHDIHEAIPVGRNGLVEDKVSEPVPEKDLPNALEPSSPPGWPLCWSLPGNEEDPRLHVKVEASKTENWIVQVCL